MASDADKKYKDQGSSFGESFAPIVDALTNAYNAYMDADQNYSDFVNAEFEDAALLIADAGFTAADFLGEVIDDAIMDFGMSDSDKELTNKVLGWVKGAGATVLSPLIDAGHEVIDFIKPYGGTLDSALINEIDRPLKKWIAGEIEEIVAIFEGVVEGAKIDEETGRFGWEKSLTDAIQNFGKNFVARIKEMDTNPDLQEGADVFANELDARITNLQLLIRTASGDELEDVPAWEAELDLLTERLTTMPEDDDPEALAEWMAGTPDTPEGLRVTDTFSVRGDDKQILEDAIDVVEAKGPRFDSAADKKYRDEASVLAASKRIEKLKTVINPGESGITPARPPENDQTIQDRSDREERRGRQEATLAEAEAGIVPDGRPAWEQRQDFLAATAVAEGWTAPGREPPAEKDGDDNENTNPYDLTDEAYKYITENFGSVDFFLRQKDLMDIDTNGDGVKDTNIIDFIEAEQEENPDVIWGLFQKTEWFALNGPTARQFQVDWDKAQPGGADPNWSPQWNRTGEGGWTNMTPDMLEMLGDTYDSLVLEASRLLGASAVNTPAKKEAIMQMAYNARQLNMTDYELKNEFIENSRLAFDPIAIRNSGTFGAIRNKLKSNAGTYMITIGDDDLDRLSQQIYLNKATYEGLSSIWAQQAREDNPAVASLIDQGYTPSAYFSSYANVASNLLGRQIDFLGGDNKMYGALTDTMIGENGLERPMTRGEFKRYVRQTPEWDTTENARDEAYSTVGTLLDSFGINN